MTHCTQNIEVSNLDVTWQNYTMIVRAYINYGALRFSIVYIFEKASYTSCAPNGLHQNRQQRLLRLEAGRYCYLHCLLVRSRNFPFAGKSQLKAQNERLENTDSVYCNKAFDYDTIFSSKNPMHKSHYYYILSIFAAHIFGSATFLEKLIIVLIESQFVHFIFAHDLHYFSNIN